MRIYNGTKSSVDLPLTSTQRITIGPKSVSKDFMPSNEFLSLIVSAYDNTEFALIVSGPYEINMCAAIPALSPLIVQSLDQALERFAMLDEKKEQKEEEKVVPVTNPEPVKEEVKEEPVKVEEPVVDNSDPEVVPEAVNAVEEEVKSEPEAVVEEKPQQVLRKAVQVKKRK